MEDLCQEVTCVGNSHTFRGIVREIVLNRQLASEVPSLVRSVDRADDVCLHVQHVCLVYDHSHS